MLMMLLALCFSCRNNTREINEELESYSTDGCHTGTLKDAFSDVELTELKYDGKDYPKAIGRMFIDSNLIFIGDSKDNIYIYSQDGSPISSSLSVRGEGPGEHPTVMGFSWNPYSKLIEIITPKDLMFYDEHFNLVKSCDLKTIPGKGKKKGLMYQAVFDISPDLHIMSPSGTSDRPYRFIIYNSRDENFVGEISYEDDAWSFMNMQTNNFFRMSNGQIFCHPSGLLPYSYEFDPETLTLNKTIELETSGDEITHAEIKRISGPDAVISDYLLKSDKSIPINTIITPDKLLVTFKKGNSIRGFSTVIFNRANGEATRYKLYDAEGRTFPLIMYATDDYAYSIVEKTFIEENPSLLLNSKERMSDLLSFDDESWVVMKYKFKN